MSNTSARVFDGFMAPLEVPVQLGRPRHAELLGVLAEPVGEPRRAGGGTARYEQVGAEPVDLVGGEDHVAHHGPEHVEARSRSQRGTGVTRARARTARLTMWTSSSKPSASGPTASIVTLARLAPCSAARRARSSTWMGWRP